MNDNSIEAAQHIVTQMPKGNFIAVEQRLTARIKPVPEGKLQATWQGLEQQIGAFQQQVKAYSF